MYIDFDILSVIAEGFAEDCQAADMLRVVVHSHAETDTGAIVEVKAVDGHIGNFQAVDVCTVC